MSELQETNFDHEDRNVLSTARTASPKKKKSSKTKEKKSKSSKIPTESNGTESYTTEKAKGVTPDFEKASRRNALVSNQDRSVKSDSGNYIIDRVKKNPSRSRTKPPQPSTPSDSIMSIETQSPGLMSTFRSPSLPIIVRDDSSRSERTYHMDEKLKYMMAQLKLET